MVHLSGRRGSQGLESLRHLDKVLIRQTKGKPGVNTYQVNDEDDQTLFTMVEKEFGIPGVIVNAEVRGFDMNALDMHQQKVFSFHRPRTFNKTSDHIQVFLGGRSVGLVSQKIVLLPWSARFIITDPQDNIVYRIKGDMRCNNCQIQTANKTQVGSIKKKFTTVLQELFTTQDDYVITFAPHCPLELKAAIICSCILIDFKYHEG